MEVNEQRLITIGKRTAGSTGSAIGQTIVHSKNTRNIIEFSPYRTESGFTDYGKTTQQFEHLKIRNESPGSQEACYQQVVSKQ